MRHVGGLVLVRVIDDEGVARPRHVRLGRRQGDGFVEVLAGLGVGETIATEEPS